MTTDQASLTDAQQVGLQAAQSLLRGILIPPSPEVLTRVLKEQRKPEPDLSRIADIIGEDVALAASTLKVVNSPLYGLQREIRSIDHAVRLLGVSNVVHLVTGLLLQNAFKGQHQALERFWAASRQLALVAAHASKVHPAVSAEEAYAVGLFCDCGVPMLIKRDPQRYLEVYTAGLRSETEPVTDAEQAVYGTDHTYAGFLVARSWKLPDVFCQAILRHHHEADYFSDPPDELADAVPMLAVMQVAHRLYRLQASLPEQRTWTAVGPPVLDYLGLDEAAVDDMARALAAVASDPSVERLA